MEEITAMLQRMRSGNPIQMINRKDREYLQDEVNQLIREIDRISETTQFNSMNILDGSWDARKSVNSQIMNVSIEICQRKF